MIALFAWADCTRGTSVGASAAVHAEIRVDHIEIALGDRTLRAFTDTGTACDTGILRNLVSHNRV